MEIFLSMVTSSSFILNQEENYQDWVKVLIKNIKTQIGVLEELVLLISLFFKINLLSETHCAHCTIIVSYVHWSVCNIYSVVLNFSFYSIVL